MPGNKKNQIFSSMEIEFNSREKIIPYEDSSNNMNTEMVDEAKKSIDSTIKKSTIRNKEAEYSYDTGSFQKGKKRFLPSVSRFLK